MTELILYPEKQIVFLDRALTSEEKLKFARDAVSGITSWNFNETGAYRYSISHIAGGDGVFQYLLHRSNIQNIKVTYTVTPASIALSPFSGGVQLYYGGTLGTVRTANGTYTEYITKGTTDDIFGFIADSSDAYIFDGAITDIIITTNQSVDINQDLDFMISKAIKNPVTPSVIANDFTQNSTLPGTHNNNDIFKDIYDFGLLIEFPVDKVIKCQVLVDGIPIFKGTNGLFKLTGVKKLRENIEYDFEIYGSLKTIFTELGEKLLSELNLTAYDHEYNATNITASWDKDTGGTLGEGYYYPFINYGWNFSTNFLQNNDIVAQGYFYPAVFIKTLVDAMFTDTGFTYDSTFFDTDEFKKRIFPYCNENNILNPLPCCQVAISSAQSVGVSTNAKIDFDDETSPFYDDVPVGGSFTPASNTFTVPRSGRYRINMQLEYATDDDTQKSAVVIYINNVPYPAIIQDYMQDNDTYNFEHIINLYAGDAITFKVFTEVCNITLDASTDPTNGTWVQFTYLDIYPGYTQIEMSKIVPNMRCVDLLMDLIKMDNLVMLPTDNYNEYYIEPYSDYADTGTLRDWTYKLALDKPIDNRFQKDGLAKIASFNFADDRSEAMYKMECEMLDNYFQVKNKRQGSYVYKSSDTTLEGENSVDVSSAVAIVKNIEGYYADDAWIIPHFIDYKAGWTWTNITPKTGMIPRMMYFHKKEGFMEVLMNGSLTTICPSCSIFLDNLDQSSITNQALVFFYDGSVSHNFTNVTGRNLYNLRYKKFIDEIYNKDSRLITAYFNLNIYDILTTEFKDIIFIDGLTYRLVSVDYNLNKNELSKCKLLKIANGIDYSYPNIYTYDNNSGLIIEDNSNDVLMSAPIVISSADILTLNSQKYVALKGVRGYTIDIISVVAENILNTTAYSAGTNLLKIGTDGASGYGWTLTNGFVESTSNYIEKATKTDKNDLIQGADIVAYMDADPTLGDGEIILHIAYRLVKNK